MLHPTRKQLQSPKSGPVSSCLSFLKIQHVGHTGGNLMGVMGHIDNIRFALVPDNLNGIQNPLSIGAVESLAGLIHNQDQRGLDH